jgi:dolichol-phosphate mannosyltransferase
MIYVCIPSYNEAATVGLVLWKIRKVFEDFPREYMLLLGDDGSTDGTAELLEPYANVLPLAVTRHPRRMGYGPTVAALLHQAQQLSDRPKRDCAILLHADFSHDPAELPEFVRRIESGADLVAGEATVSGEPSRWHRLARRLAPMLLRRAVRIRGVTDTISGFAAFRLSSLRPALSTPRGEAVRLSADGWAASAELLGRAAQHARRIDAIPITVRHDRRVRPSRQQPWEAVREAWRAGGRIKLGGAT